ncbi:MAG: transcriptional repressor, partial [Opitutae bacterium]|nr:transcriptional repressor [Opitutae bacterium]
MCSWMRCRRERRSSGTAPWSGPACAPIRPMWSRPLETPHKRGKPWKALRPRIRPGSGWTPRRPMPRAGSIACGFLNINPEQPVLQGHTPMKSKKTRGRAKEKTEDSCHWRGVFHAAGLRMSRMRLAILRALKSRCDHPTIQDLHVAVRQQYPRVSKFTVYRAMNAMEAAGLVRRIAVWKGCVRYDGELTAHAHFLCETCGRVMDVAGH